MKKGKVVALQLLTFWVQLYLAIKFAPTLIHYFNYAEWWLVFNTWLNSSLETKMIGLPIVIVGCLAVCVLYVASFLYPQYLIEKLED